jgi:hypothetical protein
LYTTQALALLLINHKLDEHLLKNSPASASSGVNIGFTPVEILRALTYPSDCCLVSVHELSE